MMNNFNQIENSKLFNCPFHRINFQKNVFGILSFSKRWKFEIQIAKKMFSDNNCEIQN